MTTETDTLAIPATDGDAGWQPGSQWELWGDGLRSLVAGICWATVTRMTLADGGTGFAAIVDGELLHGRGLDHPFLFRHQRDAIDAAVEATGSRAGGPPGSRRDDLNAAAAMHDRAVDKWLYSLARAEGGMPHLAAWRHSIRQGCDVWTLDVSGRSAAVVEMPSYRTWRRCYALVVNGGEVVADDAGNLIEFDSIFPAMRVAADQIGI